MQIHVSMRDRNLLTILGALAVMASACTLPTDDAGQTPAAPTLVSVDQASERLDVLRPSCAHHYSCCMDTKLGFEHDTPDHTRCYYCQSRCNDEGLWPKQTYYRKDCQYWKKKYELRDPRGECR